LPNAADVILDIRKIEDYWLYPSHPCGRHKARVFEALNLTHKDSAWLRDALPAAARNAPGFTCRTDAWSTYWKFDATITRQDKCAVVRNVWMARPVKLYLPS
jgi:hypothetical protein